MVSVAFISSLPRRWLRFSLRTLLAFTLLIGFLLGWVVTERRQSAREQQLAVQLKKQGWRVALGGPLDSSALFFGHGDQGWWRKLARRILGSRIVILYAIDSPIDDLTTLEGLSNLRVLRVDFSQVADLDPLRQLTTLERLGVSGIPAGDLAPVASLERLNVLYVHRKQLTKQQMEGLQELMPTCKIEHDPFQ